MIMESRRGKGMHDTQPGQPCSQDTPPLLHTPLSASASPGAREVSPRPAAQGCAQWICPGAGGTQGRWSHLGSWIRVEPVQAHRRTCPVHPSASSLVCQHDQGGSTTELRAGLREGEEEEPSRKEQDRTAAVARAGQGPVPTLDSVPPLTCPLSHHFCPRCPKPQGDPKVEGNQHIWNSESHPK